MRKDGTIVENQSAYSKFISSLMVTRSDTQNYVCQYIDIMPLRNYNKNLPKSSGHISYMSFIICAYLKALAKYPQLNRFVARGRLYQRNTISVSFVILKKNGSQELDQTVVKVYLDQDDDLKSVNTKIVNAIRNEQTQSNKVDLFLNFFTRFPFLIGIFSKFLRLADKYGYLPKRIIDLSPFHTSLFFSNLASIGVEHIYHHLYEFGTTSLFAALGRPIRWHPTKGQGHYFPMGIVMDERICTGYEFGMFYKYMEKYLNHPELMETEICNSTVCDPF